MFGIGSVAVSDIPIINIQILVYIYCIGCVSLRRRRRRDFFFRYVLPLTQLNGSHKFETQGILACVIQFTSLPVHACVLGEPD